MMSRQLYTVITVLALLLPLTACHTSKKSASVVQPTGELSLRERFELLASSYSEWEDVTVPVKLDLSSPKRLSVSGRAVMERGKSIFISLRVFGMEIGNVYVTGDSVYAVDKIHKYIVAENITRFLGGFPLTINDMQDLLLGQAFLLENGRLSKSDYKKIALAQESVGEWTITPKDTFDGISYTFGVAGESNAVSSLMASKDSRVLPVGCKYSSHVKGTGAGTIAQKVSIAGKAGTHDIEASLRWSVDDTEWNTGNPRQWNAPKNYKQIAASSLLKALESF